MIARAIVGRPSLLLIDGLIDALPDEEALDIMEPLTRPDQPWTLMVITGRSSIADLLERVVEMRPKNIENNTETIHAS